MKPPTPLPRQLIGQVFTRRQARMLGVSEKRLRARDLERVARATYRHRTAATKPPLNSGLLEAEDLDILRMLCSRSTVVRASHVTAAQLYGLPLPSRLSDARPIHLTGRSRSHYGASDPHVVLHRVAQVPDCTHHLHGIPVSPPEVVFVELARYLCVPELVVVGDQLVRIPRAELEERDAAWCSLKELELSVTRARGRLGIGRVREALGRVRVGADSAPETRLRLALVDAGLPEPELQIPLNPHHRYSPVGDAGYRRQKIVLQYEGAYHFSPEQQAHDQHRNAEFEHDGWAVVLVNRVDLREGFRRTVERIRVLLKQR